MNEEQNLPTPSDPLLDEFRFSDDPEQWQRTSHAAWNYACGEITGRFKPYAQKFGNGPVDFCSGNEFFQRSQEETEKKCREFLGNDSRTFLYGCSHQARMTNPESIPYRKPKGEVYVSDLWENSALNDVFIHEIGHQALTTARQMIGAHHASLGLFFQPHVPDAFVDGLYRKIKALDAKMDAADKVHYNGKTGKIYLDRNFDLFGELEKIFDEYTNRLETERRKWRRQ